MESLGLAKAKNTPPNRPYNKESYSSCIDMGKPRMYIVRVVLPYGSAPINHTATFSPALAHFPRGLPQPGAPAPIT